MIFRSIILASIVAWITGCQDQKALAPSAGTYGPAPELPAAATPSPKRSVSGMWTNAELAIVQSQLSPASLCSSTGRTLSFFTRTPSAEVGGPMFLAISTQQGPKIFRPGEKLDPARMRESWFVVWFAGATGWTNWDSPWFLTLQHRPQTIRFDTNGLHFGFPGAAGFAAVMPLYGAYKALPAGQELSPFSKLKEKKKRVLTWEWHLALPADPLSRARYWASALREFPIGVEETFSVDRAHDSVVLEQKIAWLSWTDDWNTRPLKLAPVSPVVALAYKEGLPAEFSPKPFDMEIFTDYGPFHGIQEADSFRVTLPVLGYVHETGGVGESVAGKLDAPCFAAWQAAHAQGAWETLATRWPELRATFAAHSSPAWPAFGSLDERSALARTTDALGAARIAYRLRDMDTYAHAAHVFARALVQLVAEQRGINYFREHQPWRSMEPLSASAALVGLTTNGWVAGPASMETFAGVPDIARLLRDAQPPAAGQPPGPGAKRERLIPGGRATPFLANRDSESNAFSGLVHSIECGNTGGWPRMVWTAPQPGSDTGWNFGAIMTTRSAAVKSEVLHLDANTRVTVVRRQ